MSTMVSSELSSNSNLLILSNEFDTLLWPSVRSTQVSAWHGHVSFAHWIIQVTRPNILVELGTHNGVSFAAFCNAVKKSGSLTKCYAVDTWTGDAHAGFYNETVFESFDGFTRLHFESIATLMRCRFDEALTEFADSSIDLLHIDGRHTYEAVSEDFNTWLPKLSQSAVVLFHDIAIKSRDFGVWRLWDELSSRYPHFSFRHSAGLGVLSVGPNVPPAIEKLCQLTGTAAEDIACERFIWASDLASQNGKSEAELQAAETLQTLCGNGTNIALGCNAFQSSVYDDASGLSSAAVNGVRTGSFAFSTRYEANPWWMVDLGSNVCFHKVIIFNRLDSQCPERAQNLVLLASSDGEVWTELHRAGGKVFGGIDGNPLVFECSGVIARFVRIRLDDTTFLHLDQVEIYSNI